MGKEPIQSKAEAIAVFKRLTAHTSKRLGISIIQAQKRVEAALNSDVFTSGNPEDPATQKAIDKILQTPID